MYPGKKVTHILTAASLSGSKTHALLTKTVGWKPVVVDPMWIVECVNSGKRIGSEKWKIGGIRVNQPSIGQFITRPGSTSSSISKSIQPRANLTRPSSRSLSVSCASPSSIISDHSSTVPVWTQKRTSTCPSVCADLVKPAVEVIDLCDSDNN
uniref:DNA repair protein Rev1 n=1 Tax=Phaffia rhodozyma TaxID=264483 RepID=A0A1I9Q723_PHARH|nr:DNA repair protein Rev1 [Phaffia rhodozyma]